MSNPHSPEGLQVIASYPEKGEMSPSSDEFEVSERGYWNRKYRCGHRGARWFVLSTYGEKTKRIRNKERCHECFCEHAKTIIIRCALCGFPIYPGSAVALYCADSEGLRPDSTTLNGNAFGCLRMDCCPSGGFYAGNWTEQGFCSAFDGGQSIAESAMTNRRVEIM